MAQSAAEVPVLPSRMSTPSYVVEPAASLPVMARQYGSQLVIVNRDSTQLDSFANLVIHDNIADTLKITERWLADSGRAPCPE